MVWIDPDRPEDLFDRHWLSSSHRSAPLRFRFDDYGTDDAPPGADAVRAELAPVVDRYPDGPIRMLTQPRRWGWLFNPLTLYFAWTDSADDPVGVVAEVTNTPWKERHRYAVRLGPVDRGLAAGFGKELHVSPFLDRDHRYELLVRESGNRLVVELDVIGDDTSPTLETRLIVDRQPVTRSNVRSFVFADSLSTHRVSGGIHLQALRLWRKGVSFVPHCDKHQQRRREMI